MKRDTVKLNQRPPRPGMFPGLLLAALLWAIPDGARAEAAAALPSRAYVEILSVAPVLVLLAALVFTIRIDPYICRRHKRILRTIAALVLGLIIQSFAEYRLTLSEPMIVARTLAAIYGYVVRPVILVLFCRVVKPEKKFGWAWALIGANAAIHSTALFSHVCFWIDGENHYHGGPLQNACLVVSAVLLAYLFYITIRESHPAKRLETWIPLFSVLTIAGSVLLDKTVGMEDQPMSFLTIAVVISFVFYYIWLHLQFVREHENDLRAQQRIQIMISQIQPHFLYNTLSTIQALCVEDPPRAARVVKRFGTYLRQNIDSLNESNLIPFSKELEHTRIYAEIEMERFPNVHITYDVDDDGFLVPALTLQPLVENAIRHGVRIRDDGRVSIVVRAKEGGRVIVIRDNGKGFDPAAVQADTGHIGIQNVRERLEKLCGGTMDIDSTVGEGTTVTIRIPGAPYGG